LRLPSKKQPKNWGMMKTMPRFISVAGITLAIVISASVGEKGNVAGAFNGAGQLTLVPGTGAGLTPRPDFSFVGDKPAQNVNELVINVHIFIGTELADLRF